MIAYYMQWFTDLVSAIVDGPAWREVRRRKEDAEQVALREEQDKMRSVKQRPNWSHNH